MSVLPSVPGAPAAARRVARLPVAGALQASRETIAGVLAGSDPRLLVVAGPATLPEARAAHDLARRVAAAARWHRRELVVLLRAEPAEGDPQPGPLLEALGALGAACASLGLPGHRKELADRYAWTAPQPESSPVLRRVQPGGNEPVPTVLDCAREAGLRGCAPGAVLREALDRVRERAPHPPAVVLETATEASAAPPRLSWEALQALLDEAAEAVASAGSRGRRE